MKTTYEILMEMPKAIIGDWNYGVVTYLGEISNHLIQKKYILLDEIDATKYGKQQLFLYKLRNSLDFILGYFQFDSDKFQIVGRLGCKRLSSLENRLNLNHLIKIDGVAVLESFQGLGIGTYLYSFLTETLHYEILSDKEQYDGARMLWRKLSHDVDRLVVDVVDVDKFKIIERNVILSHEVSPEKFDTTYWSIDKSKENIRFLLRKFYK